MAPQEGLEPTTDRLTADSSTTELLWNNLNGAGDGNRTHNISLEGWGFAIKLHPHFNDYGADDGNRTHECRNHNPMR